VVEAVRFIRKPRELEDVRVRTAAMCSAAVVLGTQIKLNALATETTSCAKRFLGTPDYRYCAIADSILEILRQDNRRNKRSGRSWAEVSAQTAPGRQPEPHHAVHSPIRVPESRPQPPSSRKNAACAEETVDRGSDDALTNLCLP
jgi:hypothetical protein